MKKIEIDLDVWKWLQNNLLDLNETENDVLRRLLKIGANNLGNTDNTSEELFINQIGNVKAKGKLLPGNRFLVFSGSTISPRQDDSIPGTYITLKILLVKEGYIVNNTFIKDCEFTSPSAAASVILGGSRSGNREWKNSKGLNLKEYQLANS